MSATVTGFLTDSTLCIGCKACEVACKEWNGVSEDGLNWSGNSYDNTGAAGAFYLETCEVCGRQAASRVGVAMPESTCRGSSPLTFVSIVKSLDVWKPAPPAQLCAPSSGASSSSPMSAMVAATALCPVPSESCNATRTMVGFSNAPSATTGRKQDCIRPVRRRVPRSRSSLGRWSRCALGAQERMQELRSRGMDDAQLYDPQDTSVGGTHAMFIVRGDPRQYNLPPNPEVPTSYLRAGWTGSAVAAGLLLFGSIFAFLGSPRR